MDDLGTLLLIALVLACPITMIWMMRGKHRPRGHDRHGHPPADENNPGGRKEP
jgi:hypothetical protein